MISDQDLRCADQLKALKRPQISPLPNGAIISTGPYLNQENSSNAVFEQINVVENEDNLDESNLTFNGKIPGSEAVEESGIGTSETTFQSSFGRFTDSFQEYSNERSPDLFHCEDDDDGPTDEDGFKKEPVGATESPAIQQSKEQPNLTDSKAAILRNRDNCLLKRIQAAFSGVLPPPSVTNMTFTVDMIVSKYREFEDKVKEETQSCSQAKESFMKALDSNERAKEAHWPDLASLVCHDVQ